MLCTHSSKLKVFSSVFTILGFYSIPSYSTEMITKEFDSADVKKISVENGSGNIQITGHDKKLVTIEAKIVSGTKESCDVQVEKNSGEVFVKTKSKKTFSLFSRNPCEVHVIINSPTSMNLNIKNGSGDVQISKIEGTLNAMNGSGHLSAKGSFNEASVSVGSGDVSILGVKGISDVNVGSGDAELTYSIIPPSGGLHVNLGSGNLTVLLPKKASVQTKVRMGSGTLKNQLDNNVPGPFAIQGNIGSGDLVLRNI